MVTIIRWRMLTACGLNRIVTDSMLSLIKSVFYNKIKRLYPAFSLRTAINPGRARTLLATMRRVYRLQGRKSVGAADYQALLRTADSVLKDDVMALQELLVVPAGSTPPGMPVDEHAQFLAVEGLFNLPTLNENHQRLVQGQEKRSLDNFRVIESGDGWLSLMPVKE